MINNGYVTPQPLADSLRPLRVAVLVVDQPSGRRTVLRRRSRSCSELGGLDRYITTGQLRPPDVQERVPAEARRVVRPVRRRAHRAVRRLRHLLRSQLLEHPVRRALPPAVPAARHLLQDRVRADGSRTAPCGTRATYDPRSCARWRLRDGARSLPRANDLKPPKTYQFSGGVRQTFARRRVTVSYNAIRGFNGMNYVRVSPWRSETTSPRNYKTVFVTDDRVRTWYDAHAAPARPAHPRRRRWGGAIAYTFARSEEQGQSTDIFWGFDDRFPTVPRAAVCCYRMRSRTLKVGDQIIDLRHVETELRASRDAP